MRMNRGAKDGNAEGMYIRNRLKKIMVLEVK